MFKCVPVCIGCKEAGECTAIKEKLAKQRDWRPDRLALKKLVCGHRAPYIPAVLGKIKPSHVWCDRCGGWVPLTFPDPDPVEPEKNDEFPF